MAYHADSSDLDTKEILTWEGLGSASRELAQDIANAGFEPDVIIAVARGSSATTSFGSNRGSQSMRLPDSSTQWIATNSPCTW